ncbi:kelch-like protein 24 isoform X1 [Lampetra fluviatilis]
MSGGNAAALDPANAPSRGERRVLRLHRHMPTVGLASGAVDPGTGDPVRANDGAAAAAAAASLTTVAAAVSVAADEEDDDPGVVFSEPSHPSAVLLGVRALREAGALCDVTLCCGTSEFPCHRLLLAACSPYFRAMFSAGLAESRQERVTLAGVDASSLGLLLSYAYTGEVRICRANVQALLAAADLLDVPPVRQACARFLQSQLDVSNCLGMHCFAEAHACPELQRASLDFALQHFASVWQQEEFGALTSDKLLELLASDRLNAPREETVFQASLAWLNRTADRRQYADKVFELVRFPLMSPYYIHDVVEKQSLISESAICQRLVSEAKDFMLLQDRRGELVSPRTRPRYSSGITEVIIAVGGEDDKVVLRSVECYGPQSGQWKALACLPFAVSKHGLVVSGNTLYMAGGEFPDGLASRDTWRYDPSFDTWQEMAQMNVARSELGLAMLDGFVFAVGGWEGSSRLDSVEGYDPSTNCWQFVAPMRMAVTSPAVVALDGLLYVTGGAVLEDGDGIELVQVYNPKMDTWSEVPPMQIARSGSAACVLKGKIYVIGGWHASTENTNKVECYDPAQNSWHMCAPMIERRYRPGVAVVDGKIYVLGGEEGWDRYHDTIERYDDLTDTWEIVGEMPTSRSWLSCVSIQIHQDIRTSSPGSAEPYGYE